MLRRIFGSATFWRWLALFLTLWILVVVNLLLWKTIKIQNELEILSKKQSIVSVRGYPEYKLDRIHNHITSIEAFIRTTPLVECRGNEK
jgi:hypothetical protein